MTDAASRNLPKILMIAYACNPEGGGEHWLGWGWAEQAAKNYSVQLITTPNARSQVESHALRHGITPHFVEPPKAGRWGRKIGWQSKVVKLAAELQAREKFAIVHQTTFHTFRVPFLAAGLGIPSVWGPIAGGETTPPGFGRFLGPARLGELNRKLVNHFCLALPAIRRSLRNASALFVSNRTTLNFLPASVRAKCRVVSPNALRPEDETNLQFNPRPSHPAAPLQLLYVGNCVHTRALPLVFTAMKQPGLENSHLTIVGAGVALDHWKQLIQREGLAARVTCTGAVAREQLPGYYQSADVLVFPALRDSGGSALLEAMSKGLPVICLDWGGPGEMLTERCGVKITVTTPAKTITEFADGLRRLQQSPSWREELGRNAVQQARTQFTWTAKRLLLEQTYNSLLAPP